MALHTFRSSCQEFEQRVNGSCTDTLLPIEASLESKARKYPMIQIHPENVRSSEFVILTACANVLFDATCEFSLSARLVAMDLSDRGPHRDLAHIHAKGVHDATLIAARVI